MAHRATPGDSQAPAELPREWGEERGKGDRGEEEDRQIQSLLVRLQQANENVRGLRNEMLQLDEQTNRDISETEMQHKMEVHSHLEAMAATQESIEAEADSMEDKTEEMLVENMQMSVKLEQLRNKLASLTSLTHQKKDELQQRRTTLEELNGEYNKLQDESIGLRSSIERLTQREANAHNMMQELQDEYERLEQRRQNENVSFLTSTSNIVAERAKLREGLDNMTRSMLENDTAQKELENEATQLQEDIYNITERKKILSSQIANQEKTFNRLKTERKERHTAIEELQAEKQMLAQEEAELSEFVNSYTTQSNKILEATYQKLVNHGQAEDERAKTCINMTKDILMSGEEECSRYLNKVVEFQQWLTNRRAEWESIIRGTLTTSIMVLKAAKYISSAQDTQESVQSMEKEHISQLREKDAVQTLSRSLRDAEGRVELAMAQLEAITRADVDQMLLSDLQETLDNHNKELLTLQAELARTRESNERMINAYDSKVQVLASALSGN